MPIHVQYFAGELRFTLGAVYYAFAKRKYRGRLQMFIPPPTDSTTTATSPSTNMVTPAARSSNESIQPNLFNTSNINPESTKINQSGQGIYQNNEAEENNSKVSVTAQRHDSEPLLTNSTSQYPINTSKSVPSAQHISIIPDLPPLKHPINNGVESSPILPTTKSTDKVGWVTLESEFNLIWVLQTSHSTSTIYSSPQSRLNDGLFTILVTTDCTTLELLHLLILAESGEHINHPKVKVFKATAFRFEPLNLQDGGIYSIDGEIVNYGPIQGRILPGAATVLG